MEPFPSFSSKARIHVVRFGPGVDLRKSLQQLASHHHWSAGVIVTCVGSLVEYNLRFANQRSGSRRKGHFEIISLTGTISHSSVHLHLSVSDEKGVLAGGHLLEGNMVFTTAEVAVAELPDIVFDRALDPASGYHELHLGLSDRPTN